MNYVYLETTVNVIVVYINDIVQIHGQAKEEGTPSIPIRANNNEYGLSLG